MHSILTESKQIPMFDIRRKVAHNSLKLDDACAGIHQADCSLAELYGLALCYEPVTLTCLECGHQAGIVDLGDALETAAVALADELRSMLKTLRTVRATEQADVMQGMITTAELDGNEVEWHDIRQAVSRHAMKTAVFASRISRMTQLDC